MSYVVAKRPKIITWLCVIGFILVVLSMPSVFSPETRHMGLGFPALFGLLIAFRFIACVGIWYMKRWGVELFLITFTAILVEGIVRSDFGVISIVYHVAGFVILMFWYKKMDRNL